MIINAPHGWIEQIDARARGLMARPLRQRHGTRPPIERHPHHVELLGDDHTGGHRLPQVHVPRPLSSIFRSDPLKKNINNNDWAQISMKPIIGFLLTDIGWEIRSNFIYKSFCSFGWLQCCVSVAPLTFFCSFLSQAFSRTTKLAISTPSRWIRQWFILMNDWHFLQLAS